MEDIDILLNKWHETKEQISDLEKKVEKYKRYAEKIMNEKRIDELSNDVYVLSRRDMSRTTLSKDDLPGEMWAKYSRNIKYPMYTLRKIKTKK